MQRYVSGTEAYRYERELREPDGYRKKTEKSPRKKSMTKKSVSRFIVCTLLFVALAAILLVRFSFITEKTAQLAKLTEEYDAANSLAVQKKFELEQGIDLKEVEEIAKTKLGMQRPQQHQMVAIDMNNTDYAEPVKGSHDAGGESFLAYIGGGISDMMEYFK